MHKNLKEDFFSNLGEETHNTNHKRTNKLHKANNVQTWGVGEKLKTCEKARHGYILLHVYSFCIVFGVQQILPI